jgi:hypothetical protein
MPSHNGWTYRAQWVKCGKSRCKSCPHGPYWYRFKKIKGRTKSEYVGKKAPWVEQEYVEAKDANRMDDIFGRRSATDALALEILGMDASLGKAEAKRHYRKLCLEKHPDRGGDAKAFSYVSAAWSWLCCSRGW